jgi:TolB-like protein
MKKILILPFHLSQKFENSEYLPEGVLEELIYELSSLNGFQTTSRSTSLYLASNPIPQKNIFEKFEVDYILEGSIRKEQSKCFFVSQFYEAETERLIFNSKIPFHIDSWTIAINALSHKISEKVFEKTIIKNIEVNPTKKREFYQQGLYHWNRFTYEEMLLGISFFKKAIKEDVNFTQAHAAIADCYSIIGLMGYDKPKEAFLKAKESVEKALILNDKRSESYVSAAFINIFFDIDFIKAKKNLEQALKLNSKSMKAHHVFAMYYIHISDLENAKKHSLITLKLDALSLPHYAMMTRISLYKRNFEEGLDFIEAGLNINENAMPLIELRGVINILSGNAESAIEDFKSCVNSDVNNSMHLAYLGYAYSKIGFYAEARTIETRINALDMKRDNGIYDYSLAILKLGQNNIKEFFIHLKKAVTFGLGFLPGELLNNPIFNEIKQHPKAQLIRSKMGYDKSSLNVLKKKRVSTFITLQSHTKEILTLDPQDISFVESNDNYVFVHHLKDGIIIKTMLRISLKNFEQQLTDYPYLVRCHKSFMISLDAQMKINGNSKFSYFESMYFPKRIPISRSKQEKMTALLAQYN